MNRPAPSADSLFSSAAVPVLYLSLLFLLFLLFLPLLPPVVSAAEIHRCTLTDGTVVFQDQLCQEGTSQVLRGAGKSRAISEASLRKWLQQQPDKPPQASAAQVAPSSNPPAMAIALPSRPQSEQLLAECSERVLLCAGEGPRAMDGCVSRISPCTGSLRQACCAPAFVERYRLLRDSDVEQRDAVRGALLGIAGE